MLLSREEFRRQVFERDNHKCIVCHNVGQDIHHIIERRLWDDGGYYLDNGATVCGSCHIKAEQTIISCNELRVLARISRIILPPQLYTDQDYTKWGDIINSNGTRTPGELFHDESVQKILKTTSFINLYSKYIKYPRTYHLPWSPGTTSEDRLLDNVDHFQGKQVIITEKMDGENISMYSDYLHARSIDSDNHLSRDWIKNFHSQIKYDIPRGWRFCGENLYAKHSIQYNSLSSYFMLFSIWTEKNICLSWNETVEWAKLLDLELVPIIYEGMCTYTLFKSIDCLDIDSQEGYVVRLADEFNYSQFRKSVAKYVRAGHVQTSHHWKRQPIIKNILA